MSLILRFYKPSSGEIYFDGRAASDFDVNALRQRIGYVSQNPLLLSGTIMENLRYGNPETDEQEVFRAAEVADIHDFVYHLPKGYESEIGERGINLSEGQKQRLSIARALVKNPDILVLQGLRHYTDRKSTPRLQTISPQSVSEELNLFGEISITPKEALQGARKLVAIPQGLKKRHVIVTIPQGVRQNTRLRLKGLGRADREGNRGDLFLEVRILG